MNALPSEFNAKFSRTKPKNIKCEKNHHLLRRYELNQKNHILISNLISPEMEQKFFPIVPLSEVLLKRD